MIFGLFKKDNLFKKGYTAPAQESTWVFSEKPYYNKEHRETMAIIDDIIIKLDVIEKLIIEMKQSKSK